MLTSWDPMLFTVVFKRYCKQHYAHIKGSHAVYNNV
jgi:hypothetical protein